MKKNNILLLLSFAIFANSCEQLALTGSNVDKEKFTQLNPVDNSENAENVIDDDFFTNYLNNYDITSSKNKLKSELPSVIKKPFSLNNRIFSKFSKKSKKPGQFNESVNTNGSTKTWYKRFIEKIAESYGYKTANLMNLKNLTQPFTLKNKVLKKKNPNISLQVPLFRGIDGKIINDVLGFYKEEKDATGKVQITPINNYLREFINSYNNTDGNSRILGKKTKQALASLRAYIIETITESKNSILENEINEFLKKANLKETDLLMVRSTGKYEDMKNLANPGGNDSFPCHANVQEIKKAVGKVVASYFSEKSLGQRLTLKKENPAAANITETYYPAVLLQKMIGEPISKPGEKPEITAKNIVSGVIYCTKEGTTIQTAPGHCELVVNSKGPIDTVYVDPLGIVHQEIRIKDFKLSPQEEKTEKGPKVTLNPINNFYENKYQPSIKDKNSALYLDELAQFISEDYGCEMDIEFVVETDRKDKNKQTVYLVQARAKHEKPSSIEPSAMNPEYLSKKGTGLLAIDMAQVITPQLNFIVGITESGEIIFAETINKALDIYTKLSDNKTIKAVIVGKKPQVLLMKQVNLTAKIYPLSVQI